MELKAGGRFSYSYGIGGCQADITGTYKKINDKVQFKNDKEFTPEFFTRQGFDIQTDSLVNKIGKPFYPDLSLIEWKVTSNGIKPLSSVNCGCLSESGKHIRK